MAKNEDGYEKYLGYIEDSLDEVAEKVTRIFDERKKGLAATLCGMLRMQRPVPPTMSGEEEIVLTIPPGNLRTAVI